MCTEDHFFLLNLEISILVQIIWVVNYPTLEKVARRPPSKSLLRRLHLLQQRWVELVLATPAFEGVLIEGPVELQYRKITYREALCILVAVSFRLFEL